MFVIVMCGSVWWLWRRTLMCACAGGWLRAVPGTDCAGDAGDVYLGLEVEDGVAKVAITHVIALPSVTVPPVEPPSHAGHAISVLVAAPLPPRP